MKEFFKKDKEIKIESTSLSKLPENALVWAGLLREG